MKVNAQTSSNKPRDPLIYRKLLGYAKTGHECWEISGHYIQSNIDIEFTNFAQPLDSSKKYIPKDEFWLDEENAPDEYRPFLIHLETEWSLCKKKVPYEKAHLLALIAEKKYRSKHRSGKTKGPYLKKMGKFDDATIWSVDGKYIRDWFDCDWAEGGHGYIYDPWIPFDEIWIDNDAIPEEIPFIIFHEGYERRLMKKKYGEEEDLERHKFYDEAHSKASAAEWKMRRKAWEAEEDKKLGELEIAEIVKDLYQSTFYTKKEIPILKKLGIDVVVDLIGQDIDHIPGIDLLKFPFVDEEKIPEDIKELETFVEGVFKRWVAGEKVLVHCFGGRNRSGLVLGMILKLAGVSGEDAVKKIQKARPGALNNKTFVRYLEHVSDNHETTK